MRLLSSIATSCGYQVITSGITFCEITGDGRWHVFEHECYRFVCHSECDHVSIILRDRRGGRELRDLGKKGERRAMLPWSNPRYDKFRGVKHLLGVKTCGLSRFAAQVQDKGCCVYLGSFDDSITAGMAHDRYVVEHGLKAPLNFPHIKELMQKELTEAVAD